jgi:hypothetical protein
MNRSRRRLVTEATMRRGGSQTFPVLFDSLFSPLFRPFHPFFERNFLAVVGTGNEEQF